MAIYKLGSSTIEKLNETTFSNEGIKERDDLQRLLKESIEVIAPDTLVIAEEFSEWAGSQRRIDLLAIDRDANLVVIELKRTEDGGYMELQAIRYASMISAMTFDRAVEVYSDYRGDETNEAAEKAMLEFLGWVDPNQEEFASNVRLVLASAEFSRELTTSVLWLNEKGLDIRCVRMKPYKANDDTLINVEQIIPLPEAEEYQISIRKKRQQQSIQSSQRDTLRRDLVVNGMKFERLPKRRIIFEVVKAAIEKGADIEDIRAGMPASKWIAIEGELDSQEFVSALTELGATGGKRYRPTKIYLSDDELFYQNGKTYALTKMWGRSTPPHVSKVAETYGLDIEIDW